MTILSSIQDRKKSIHRALVYGICAATVMLFAGTVIFLVWACYRGFDFTDEGWYLLSYRYPDDIPFGHSSYHQYIGFFYEILNYDIALLRVGGIILLLISTLIFYFGFHRMAASFRDSSIRNSMFKRCRLFDITEYCFLGLGTLLVYSWFLPSPSYNTLNAIFLNAGTGLYFAGIGTLLMRKERSTDAWLFLFFSGVFIGCSFFAKFTSGLALYGILCITSACWPKLPLPQRLKAIALLTAGKISWFLLHFILIQSISDWWSFLSGGIELISVLESGHGINSVTRYLAEFKHLLGASVLKFWGTYAILSIWALLFLIFSKKSASSFQKLFTLLLLVPVSAVAISYHSNQFIGGVARFGQLTEFYLSVMILMTAVIIVIQVILRNRQHISSLDITLLLFAGSSFGLPFMGAIGTGNQIYIITLYHIVPWFAILLILIRLMASAYKSAIIYSIAILAIAAFASSQILSGCLNDPYRLNSGVLHQSKKTEIGYPASILLLDSRANLFITKLRRMATINGFKPGDDMLAFYNMPGAVFCLGGRSPGYPWFFGGYKGSKHFAEKALSRIPRERLRKAFVLQNGIKTLEMPDFSRFGINFPSDYDLCGSLNAPNGNSEEQILLWKPKHNFRS